MLPAAMRRPTTSAGVGIGIRHAGIFKNSSKLQLVGAQFYGGTAGG